MPTSNLSLDEIRAVLDKSGVGGGTSFNMSQNKLGAGSAIRNTIYGQSQPILDNNRKAYTDQLDKIAAMDAKLASVYGDPTSPLYILNASKRQSAISGASKVGYSAATDTAKMYQDKKQQLEDSIKQTMSVYDELTQLTKAQEAETTKQQKAQETASKKQKATVKTKTGEEITLTASQQKSYSEAGIDANNPELRAVWNNTTPAFKKWFTEQRAKNKIKDKVITPKELGYYRTQYAEQKAKEKAKTSAAKKKASGGLTADEINALSAKYKK